MKIKVLSSIAALSACALVSSNASAEDRSKDFKRWSVSAGWLHVMPQGKANIMSISTAAKDGMYGMFAGANDPDYPNVAIPITGLGDYTQNAGLEADNTDTFGLMLNYYVNDKVSLQMFGGIPPKVDISGKGKIAAFPSTTDPDMKPIIDLVAGPDGIPITNLGDHGKNASVRAWTPAFTAHYHFGNINSKFRPYVGAGFMYSHFSHLKLNQDLEHQLQEAGHMIAQLALVKDPNGMIGNLFGTIPGMGDEVKIDRDKFNPQVRVKTTDAFGPVLTLGANYDLTDRIFATGSVTYVRLSNRANIYVDEANTGINLISSSTKVDLNPIITYVGIGYRF